jgi:hypothetical protein
MVRRKSKKSLRLRIRRDLRPVKIIRGVIVILHLSNILIKNAFIQKNRNWQKSNSSHSGFDQWAKT